MQHIQREYLRRLLSRVSSADVSPEVASDEIIDKININYKLKKE